MNTKQRMLRVLAGERVTPPPAVLHSWGDYKVEFAGHHPKFQYYQGGRELYEVEKAFYERFRPDWIHLGSAAWRGFWDQPRKVDGRRAFIRSTDGKRWIEILDNYLLADYSDVPWAQDAPELRLGSRAEVDDYFAAAQYTEQDILDSGRFEHMEMVCREYGDRVLVAINDGAPGYGLPNHSFEEAMIACMEKPDLVAYYIFKACEAFLTDVRAAKAAGAHAYIFSESYGGSLDLLSPEQHERLELDTKRWFYSEVRKIGILGIGYWFGDVRPNMRFLNSLDMVGLLIEEDKKGFVLDPVEVRKLLRPEICLFGNVDSTLMLRGRPDDIRAQVHRQMQAANYGTFVVANGSPLIIGTPRENIDAYMKAARG